MPARTQRFDRETHTTWIGFTVCRRQFNKFEGKPVADAQVGKRGAHKHERA
jgi:hypothetical protein